MKNIIALLFLILIGWLNIYSYTPQIQSDWNQSNTSSPAYIKNKPSMSDSTSYFNRNGRIYQQMKVWMDTFVPSTANGYSINISSAGFTTIANVQAVAMKNTATTTSVPNIAIKTYNTTSVVLNVIEGNSSLVTVLGSGVLLGVSNQFASTSGLTVLVTVTGY